MSVSDSVQDDRQSAQMRLRPVVIAVLLAKLAAAAILIANVNLPSHASASSVALSQD